MLSSVHSAMFTSLQPHGLQHARLPCPSPTPRACSNSCPLSQWGHPTISSSVVPFSSCLQSFPVSGSFPMSKFFASGGQSIGASTLASISPSSEYSGLISFRIDWFDLLVVQGTLMSFSSTTVQIYQFFSDQPYYGLALSSICDYWKNHSFDCMDLCQQSNCLCFLICCLGWS